jgi:hypothetical protein
MAENEMEGEEKYPPIKGKITCLRMEPASNGVIISYDVQYKPESSGPYDNMQYKCEKEVYDFDEEEEDSMEAFMRFKELMKLQNKA